MAVIRKILHLDLDAFFCSVEELEQPRLRGRAFAVGGRPDERGVVASCSYPARALGVRSAMSMAVALRLCPGLLIVPLRHDLYSRVSKQVMALLQAHAPLIEQISIDEAWLDVSTAALEAEDIAHSIQAQIREQLSLPCSLGVASNKLMAKVANNVGKATARARQATIGPPNAITVVAPGDEAAFLGPLPCDELWGVGPRTAERLRALGIRTIAHLAARPQVELVRLFGKNGADLWEHAHGRDDTPVVAERERKSISQETTFARDVSSGDVLRATLLAQAKDVAVGLVREDLWAGVVKLKLRWADFSTVTRQATLAEPTRNAHAIYQAAAALLEKNWNGRPVRLIGVGASNLAAHAAAPTLFDQPDPRREKLDETLRALRDRFGDDVVRSARAGMDEEH